MSSTKPQSERAITVRDFAERKRKGEKIVVMTAYDALFGRLVDESGVDAILVGDSVGTAVMGYSSTLPVTLDHMIYHASAVRRGVKRALIIIDMPFLSYQASIESAVLNCGRAIQETGSPAPSKSRAVGPEMLDTVHALVRTGIPVDGAHWLHAAIGQYNRRGARAGTRRGRSGEVDRGSERARGSGCVRGGARARAGGGFGAHHGRGRDSTIGIGAGAQCDGQVLVLPDVLGLNDTFQPKFLKRYAEMAEDVRKAIGSWAGDVRSGAYPDADHSF